MSASTKKEYGLIGLPLVHSFSAKFFNDKFKREGINAEYINFELPDIGDLMEMIAEHPRLEGFNVTRPYKELILPYLDEKSPEVEKIGAANVVKITKYPNGNFIFKGYNTDYYGFKQSLRPLLETTHTKALIFGTGGSSMAIAAALTDLGIEYKKVSRTPVEGELGYDGLDHVINECFLLVNCTPLGTFPNVHKCPDLPYHLINERHLCYDLVYNPGETEFMRRCAEQGAAVKNGLEMLRLQAERSWEIWTE